jgi:hypothetical protein
VATKSAMVEGLTPTGFQAMVAEGAVGRGWFGAADGAWGGLSHWGARCLRAAVHVFMGRVSY